METLKQLRKREEELLYQINCTTTWAGANFCASQLKELGEVRKQIEELK
tara:strand:- start:167 stop:313 length:147 start_codon:yes stop_codon:yes gene_type:complete